MGNSLDIFVTLELLDQQNLRLYDAVREDEDMLSEFNKNIGWMIPQWFTGASDDQEHRYMVLMFDEFCSQPWSALADCPELRTKLLASIGAGKRLRHRFFKPTRSRKSSSDLITALRTAYPDLNREEVALWCRHNSEKEFVEFLERLGLMPEEIDALRPEYERMRGDV